jgi:hypothetical protein
LIVGKERRRQFRLGFGVNLAYPMLSAANRLTPAIVCQANESMSHGSQGILGSSSLPDDWCFHFDRKNILVTWWEPEFNADLLLEGFQVRCQETEGRSGELTITCVQPLTSAALVNGTGRFLRALRHDPEKPNQLSYHFNCFESFQIRIRL